MRIGLLNWSPTPESPKSIAPLDVSFVFSPLVTATTEISIFDALKLVHRLLVICVQLGIVVVAVDELKTTGAPRMTLVVFVIPVHQ